MAKNTFLVAGVGRPVYPDVVQVAHIVLPQKKGPLKVNLKIQVFLKKKFHLHCGGGRGPGVPRGARQRHPHLAGGGIVADRVLNAAEALSLADADRVPGIYEKTRAIRLQSGCLVFFVILFL